MAAPVDDARKPGHRRFLPRPCGRAGSLVLAAVVPLSVVGAAFGLGYAAPELLLDNATAPVSKGDGGVASVNAETRRMEAEARALAPGKSAIEPVRLHSGRVAVVDHIGNKVQILPPDTMQPEGPTIDKSEGTPPQSADPRESAPPRLVVVAGQDNGYLVDVNHNTVERLDPRGAPVRLPFEATEDAVPDGASGIWVRAGNGAVAQVIGDQITVKINSGIRHLTVANGRPIGITDSGEVLDVGAVRKVTDERLPHGDNVVVGSWKGAGRWILIVDGRSGQLTAIDVATGTRRGPFELPTGVNHNLGAPVQVHDKVYVPDLHNNALIVYDLAAERRLSDVRVPGESKYFDLFVQDGRVWANDRQDRRTLVVGQDDQPALVDKGEGSGVTTDTANPDSKKPPQRQQPPQQQPSQPTGERPQQPAQPPNAPAEQVVVPEIRPGTPKDAACSKVRRAGLRCSPIAVPSNGPANTVITIDPPAGTRVSKGSTVIVQHVQPAIAEQAVVPALLSALIQQACDLVTRTGFTCVPRGTPDPASTLAGLGVVTAQDPAPNTKADTKTSVALQHADKAALANYVGRDGAQACQEVLQQSQQQVNCVAKRGPSQATSGKPVGTVLTQEPAAIIGIGQTLTLTVVGDSPTVPRLAGSVDAACATLSAQGYLCDRRADALARNANVVTTQEPAPGTPMDPGGTVVVHYSPYEPAPVYLYQARNGDPVWVLRVGGPEPGLGDYYDVDRPTKIGYAYAVAWQQPGANRIVNGFYCTKPAMSNCGGFERNHLYSLASSLANQPGLEEWKQYPTARFIDNCAPGMIEIHRFRNWSDGKRRYTVGLSVPGWTNVETLGCIWSP